jgi:hypothetical protein
LRFGVCADVISMQANKNTRRKKKFFIQSISL